jgi:hypothetical protein
MIKGVYKNYTKLLNKFEEERKLISKNWSQFAAEYSRH